MKPNYIMGDMDSIDEYLQGKYREKRVGVFGSLGLEYLAIEPNLVFSEMAMRILDAVAEIRNKLNWD
jgi:hypothetical protein